MKNNLLPVAFLIIFIFVFIYTFLYKETNSHHIKSTGISKTKETNKDNHQNKTKIQIEPVKVITLKDIENNISLQAIELAKALSPPNDKTLTNNWQHHYGCPKQTVNNKCLFSGILTADSYEEALWMKRHGFPSFDRLSAITKNENMPYIEELAQAGFKPALSLSAKVLSSLGEHEEAMRRAVQYLNQSERDEIYAYRLMAEIGGAKDPNNPYVIRDYQMAALLGDSEARRLSIWYAQSAEVMENGMHLLMQSLDYEFGLSRDLIPTDPRPPKP